MNLRDQGLPTDRKYLFVIDGAKALRAAIDEVFGAEQPVQRCRNHKMRNVIDELPKEQQSQALNLMRAAWRVSDAEEGVKRLEQLARFLEHAHESASEACAKAWQRCSRSSDCSFHPRFINASARPTLSRARKAAFKRERIT
jgi:transposase-like protein